jgi:hypothetical protein
LQPPGGSGLQISWVHSTLHSNISSTDHMVVVVIPSRRL